MTEQQREHPDLLAPLKDYFETKKKRYEPFPIQDYIKGVLTGVYPKPPRNSAELIYKALTVKPPEFHPAGYSIYPILTQRKDEYAIKGISRTLDKLVNYFHSASLMGDQETMLVLVFPTGAGKTTIINSLLRAIEEYTDTAEIPPVYAIRDCPVNEDPLHVIPAQLRPLYKEKYDLDITGELCPSCLAKAEEGLFKGDFGFIPDKAIKFKVNAMPFSARVGRGLTRLEPKDTSLGGFRAEESMLEAIMGSSRGMLHIPEIGHQHPAVLRTFNDFIRGRKHAVGNKEFIIDAVIIADTTTPEWEAFNVPVNYSLIERMEIIYGTYILDPRAELEVLQKTISTHNMPNQPHFGPRTKYIIANWVTRTRYRSKSDNKVPEDKKALLYSDENVDGYTQSGDGPKSRKKIEEEGYAEKEGFVGVSHPAVWKVVNKRLSLEYALAGQEHRQSCVDFIELRKDFLTFIKNGNYAYSEKDQMTRQLDQIAIENDKWLINIIEMAFFDDYEKASNQILRDYLDEVDWLFKGNIKTDKQGNMKKPNIAFLEEFENAVLGKVPSSTNMIEGKSERDKARTDLYFESGMIEQKNKKKPRIQDFFYKYPYFEEGIKKLLLARTLGDPTKGLGTPKEILRTNPKNEAQLEAIKDVKNRLIQKYDFCVTCSDRAIKYVGDKLRNQ